MERLISCDDLAAKQPAETSSIEIAPHKRLVAKMLDQTGHEVLVGRAIARIAVGIALARDDFGGPFGVVATNGELKVCSRETGGKSAMFVHGC